MLVKDLIKILQKQDANSEVIMSKDSEGNGYSPLSEVKVGVYQPDSTWSGDFFSEETIGNEEYSQPSKKASKAILLRPIN